jgi:hypothetical protein
MAKTPAFLAKGVWRVISSPAGTGQVLEKNWSSVESTNSAETPRISPVVSNRIPHAGLLNAQAVGF